MRQQWGKRLLSLAVAGAMALSVPLGVLAETFDLEKGDITVTSEEESNWVKQDGQEQKEDYSEEKGNKYSKSEEIRIKQGNDDTKSGVEKDVTSNTVTIKADEGTEVEVTLDNVNIDASNEGKAAISVEAGKGSTVTLELDGKNTAISGYEHAGVEKNGNAEGSGELVIQDKSNKDDGSLNATGGTNGAGIGGAKGQDGAKITIDGAIVSAQRGAADTGTSTNGAQKAPRRIGFEESTVQNDGGAGIGGGAGGNGSDISIINKSTVSAQGGTKSTDTNSAQKARRRAISMGENVHNIGGAGIGGGAGGTGSNIGVTDSTITSAQGAAGGAGIGGGSGKDGSNITITHSKIINAQGGNYKDSNGADEAGAGIGGGAGGNGNAITIIDSIMEAVKGGDTRHYHVEGSGINLYTSAAGIGGGSYKMKTLGEENANDGNNITITGSVINAAQGGYGSAGIGAGNGGSANTITITDSTVTAIAGDEKSASIGAGEGGANKGAIKIFGNSNVDLKVANSTEEGYIGGGKTDGTSASYEVDCTVSINGNEVESTYREDMSTTEWLWDKIGNYIHYTPGSIADNNGIYTNGNLTINCHGHPDPEQPIDLTNTGVIASTDPAAQRWYWVTALLDADENVGYTYEQIGSNLIVNADEAAQAAVLHVLLSGWAEHTEVQSITFATAGKSTTLYAGDMLGITTGEHLTLTHEYENATLAVDGRDYTYLLGEQAA